MSFRRGDRVEIYRKSNDDHWQSHMDRYVGLHGIVTDPDTVKNDPEALIEVTLDGAGTFRFPQDCVRVLKD